MHSREQDQHLQSPARAEPACCERSLIQLCRSHKRGNKQQRPARGLHRARLRGCELRRAAARLARRASTSLIVLYAAARLLTPSLAPVHCSASLQATQVCVLCAALHATSDRVCKSVWLVTLQHRQPHRHGTAPRRHQDRVHPCRDPPRHSRFGFRGARMLSGCWLAECDDPIGRLDLAVLSGREARSAFKAITMERATSRSHPSAPPSTTPTTTTHAVSIGHSHNNDNDNDSSNTRSADALASTLSSPTSPGPAQAAAWNDLAVA